MRLSKILGFVAPMLVLFIFALIGVQIIQELVEGLDMTSLNPVLNHVGAMDWVELVFWGIVGAYIFSSLKRNVPNELKVWFTLLTGVCVAVIMVGIYMGFGPGISEKTKALARWWNTGNYSYEADYVPTYRGGHLSLKRGGAKTIRVVGTISVLVPVGYFLHVDRAIFHLVENESGSRVWLTPCDPAATNVATVSLLPLRRKSSIEDTGSNDCSS